MNFCRNRSTFPLAAVSVVALSSYGPAQENLGTSNQALVNGTVVPAATQERFGLLTLTHTSGRTCSASLLRNNWAITAAHCLEARDARNNPIPDPARLGQNQVFAPGSFTIAANWGAQSTPVAQTETFRPYDIAIMRLANPITVLGSTAHFNRAVFSDYQFPYFGSEVGAALTMFGRGINRFATGSGPTAVPSQSDGQFRVAYSRPNREDANLYWFPSQSAAMIAGGDSGGPSFAWVIGGYVLAGVHAQSKVERIPGLLPSTGWTWVTATPESADAPVEPVWPAISRIIGPFRSPNAESKPPPQFIGQFPPTRYTSSAMWVYGISALGTMHWYRKDNGITQWQGPKLVGTGWEDFADIIPAGENRFYALRTNGRLMWYQHNGYIDGSAGWQPPKQVARGFRYHRFFSGGDGVIYTIRKDGVLEWRKHLSPDFGDGGERWNGPKPIGGGWEGYREVFSLGKGRIYAVTHSGDLLYYNHAGWKTGADLWTNKALKQSAGWNVYRQVVPVSDNEVLGVKEDGTLVHYINQSINTLGKRLRPGQAPRPGQGWQGPNVVGSGWNSFGKVVALLPGDVKPGSGLR